MGPANFFTMENTLPSAPELCTNQTMLRQEELRRLYPTVPVQVVKLSWKVDSWSLLPLWVPFLITVDWLPEQRKRLGMGLTEKGVGKNPRNTKPNSKLYSANQFFDRSCITFITD